MKRILCHTTLSSNYAYGIPRFCSFLTPPRFHSLRQVSTFSESEHDADAYVASFTRMLHMHPPPRVHQFNKVLGSLVKIKHYPSAISLYTQMELKGITPSLLTLTILINAYCHLGKVGFGVPLLAKILKLGYLLEDATLHGLIKGLCNSGGVEKALEFHDELVDKGFKFDEVTYGTLIERFKEGKTMAAISMLRRIKDGGVKPNVFWYNMIIEDLCREGLVDEARDWYSEMVVNEVSPNDFTYTSLIQGFCSLGRLIDALWLLDGMNQKDMYINVYIFTSIIDAYCKQGDVVEAEKILDDMIERGCEPSIDTFSALMGGYCLNNEVDEARKLFDTVLQSGLAPDVRTYNILINGYCKLRRLDDAMNLLDEMRDENVAPNLVTYNILMDYFSKSGKISDARYLFRRIWSSGLGPDIITFSILLECLCKNQQIDEAIALFNELIEKGLEPDDWSYTALIDGCCKNDRIPEAMDLLKELPLPTPVTYTSTFGIWSEERDLLNEMHDNDPPPEIIKHCLVLIDLCKTKGVYKAISFYNLMIECGFTPDVDTYSILINALCKSEKIDEAINVFKGMCLKMVPDTATLNCLVNGLWKSGRISYAPQLFNWMHDHGLTPDVLNPYDSILVTKYGWAFNNY